MQRVIPALTERQRYWLEHVQACQASGKSIVEYAAAQGGFPCRPCMPAVGNVFRLSISLIVLFLED